MSELLFLLLKFVLGALHMLSVSEAGRLDEDTRVTQVGGCANHAVSPLESRTPIVHSFVDVDDQPDICMWTVARTRTPLVPENFLRMQTGRGGWIGETCAEVRGSEADQGFCHSNLLHNCANKPTIRGKSQ